jgi:hypothetical protein
LIDRRAEPVQRKPCLFYAPIPHSKFHEEGSLVGGTSARPYEDRAESVVGEVELLARLWREGL